MQPRYRPTSVTRPLPPAVQTQVEKAVEQQPAGVQTNVTVNVIHQAPTSVGCGALIGRVFAGLFLLSILGWAIENPAGALALLVVLGGFGAIIYIHTRD